MSLTVEERFFAKVEGDSYEECWNWTGAKQTNGYGRFLFGKWPDGRYRTGLAHRWVWEFFNGPIPDGMHIDHLCRNRACVNPWHMEPVPPLVNNARKPDAYADGLCTKGLHDMGRPGALAPRPAGRRTCRECKNAAWRAMYHRRKETAA